MKLKIWIDGASRGNPGPSSFGVYIKNARGSVVARISRAIGVQTNNHAEYTGLYEALKAAAKLNGSELEIYSDSLLLVQQFAGAWKIKNENLRAYMDKIRAEAAGFESVKLAHVRRELNKDADKLANEALDREAGKLKKKPARKDGATTGPLPEHAPLPDEAPPERIERRAPKSKSAKSGSPRAQIEFPFD